MTDYSRFNERKWIKELRKEEKLELDNLRHCISLGIFASALRSTPGQKLTRLHLTLNGKIHSKDLEALSFALRNNKTLKVLELVVRKPINEIEIMRKLTQALAKNTSLQEIHLTADKSNGSEIALELGACLKENENLKELTLKNLAIDVAGAFRLAEAFKETNSLTHVDLSDNTIDGVGISILQASTHDNSVFNLELPQFTSNPLAHGICDSLENNLARKPSTNTISFSFSVYCGMIVAVLANFMSLKSMCMASVAFCIVSCITNYFPFDLDWLLMVGRITRDTAKNILFSTWMVKELFQNSFVRSHPAEPADESQEEAHAQSLREKEEHQKMMHAQRIDEASKEHSFYRNLNQRVLSHSGKDLKGWMENPPKNTRHFLVFLQHVVEKVHSKRIPRYNLPQKPFAFSDGKQYDQRSRHLFKVLLKGLLQKQYSAPQVMDIIQQEMRDSYMESDQFLQMGEKMTCFLDELAPQRESDMNLVVQKESNLSELFTEYLQLCNNVKSPSRRDDILGRPVLTIEGKRYVHIGPCRDIFAKLIAEIHSRAPFKKQSEQQDQRRNHQDAASQHNESSTLKSFLQKVSCEKVSSKGAVIPWELFLPLDTKKDHDRMRALGLWLFFCVARKITFPLQLSPLMYCALVAKFPETRSQWIDVFRSYDSAMNHIHHDVGHSADEILEKKKKEWKAEGPFLQENLDSFVEGFTEYMHMHEKLCLPLLSWRDMQSLIEGDQITKESLRKVLKMRRREWKDKPEVRSWFKEWLKKLDEQYCAAFLQHATGHTTLPSNLELFNIRVSPSEALELPQTHPCIKQIELPTRLSKEKFRDMMDEAFLPRTAWRRFPAGESQTHTPHSDSSLT